ncbi:hypothetical protein PPROV_001008100 [Pycnococcus provasolii]|uniref:BAR domain-containing protein n=1 Tax=Pycnococcus provasolii TaxID=41880 RepID=A0A830HX92_9CHLO|nr:hypothetical protein PPROV_001008100 [Pycnococcus provasolii]
MGSASASPRNGEGSKVHHAKRKMIEGMKQYLKMGAKRFMHTESARCMLMYDEVKTFKAIVDKCEKVCQSLRHANDAFFQQVASTLESNLPLSFEYNPETGAAEMVPPVQHTVAGGRGSGEEMRKLGEDVSLGLEGEVLRPIAAWKMHAESVKKRMGELEDRRLELDFYRRAVESLLATHDKLKLQLADNVDGTGKERVERRMHSTWEKKQSRDVKLQASLASYSACESEVYDELRSLIADAMHFKAYLNAAISVQSASFATAASCMEIPVEDKRQEMVVSARGSGGADAKKQNAAAPPHGRHDDDSDYE